MALQEQVMTAMKAAMKAKNTTALTSLRAIKSALLLAQTSGDNTEISQADEIKLLQKLVKQRKDSAAIFQQQGREDLATPELQQAEIIAEFLPKQLSVEEVKNVVSTVIIDLGASSMKDMGKVMKVVSEKVAGQADGKTISSIVKELLG